MSNIKIEGKPSKFAVAKRKTKRMALYLKEEIEKETGKKVNACGSGWAGLEFKRSLFSTLFYQDLGAHKILTIFPRSNGSIHIEMDGRNPEIDSEDIKSTLDESEWKNEDVLVQGD